MTELVPFVQSTSLVTSEFANISRGGLVLSDDATEDDLRRISDGMTSLLTTSWFVIGDLGNHWKKHYPASYREWISSFAELDQGTITRYMRICRRFPNPAWRDQFLTSENDRRILSSGHFAAVIALPDERAYEWLERAASEKIGVKALTAMIKESTEEKKPIIAPPSAPDTQFGYIYDLGNGNRLLCGDSSVPEHVLALFGEDRARLVVTSPPYNQELDTFQESGMHIGDSAVTRMAGAYDDDRPESEYQDEQVRVIDSLLAVTTPDASFFYNHKNRYRDKEIISPLVWLLRTQWKIRQEIIWDRPGSMTLNARMFPPNDERIYWLRRSDEFVWNEDAGVKSWFTVWKIAPRYEIKVSAPFPIEIPERPILACSSPGDIIFDPYGGSGTTLIAAAKNGRRCFLIERDPAYCDVIRDRYARYLDDLAVTTDYVVIDQPATMPEE